MHFLDNRGVKFSKPTDDYRVDFMTNQSKAEFATADWSQARFFVNEIEIKPDQRSLLFRAKKNVFKVELPSGSVRSLRLGVGENVEKLPLNPTPSFGDYLPESNGTFTCEIEPSDERSGLVELVLYTADIDLPMSFRCSVISSDLNKELTVLLDGVALPSDGVDFVGGETKLITLDYRNKELFSDVELALDLLPDPGLDDGLTAQPPPCTQSKKHVWSIKGLLPKTGTFKLKLLSNGGEAVLVTPTNRLIWPPVRMNFLSLFDSHAPEPPETLKIRRFDTFAPTVKVSFPGNAGVSGTLVNIVVPEKGNYSGMTATSGKYAAPLMFYNSVGVRALTATVTLPDNKQLTATVLIEIYIQGEDEE